MNDHRTDREIKARIAALLPAVGAEATAWPLWYICEPVILGRPAITRAIGPFFSRASADDYLSAHAYRYSDKAIVYCASAHNAPDWRELVDLLRALVPR